MARVARPHRQRLIGALLLAATWTAAAQYAVVYTKDGKSYEGDVRLGSNQLQVAGTPLRLEQIRRARFLPAAPAPAPVAPAEPAKPAAEAPGRVSGRRALLPTSEAGGQPWRRTTTKPPDDWVKPEFNHSAWDRVLGGFGEATVPHSVVRTVWKTSDIWIRRKFSLDRVPSDPRLRIYHDEHASVFINGRKVKEFASYSEGYLEHPLEGEARQALRVGENLIAIHCVNRSGGQYIDAGLYDGPEAAGNREPAEPKQIPARGLRGEYFQDRNLKGEFLVRYDPELNFDWGEGKPMAGLGQKEWSIRWTGRLEAPRSESFTFHLENNDGARLWLADKLIIDCWRDGASKSSSQPVPLKAGEWLELRLEYYNAAGRSALKLSWSSPGTPKAIVPASRLRPAPPGAAARQSDTARTDAASARPPVTTPAGRSMAPQEPPADPRLPAGLVLTGGSIVGRRAHSVDETAARFGDGRKAETLSTTGIARILPQPVLPDALQRLPAGRAGVLLANGEFVDGEFRQLSGGRVQINSVLLGLKYFDLGQITAVVLRDLEQRPARFEVRTKDNSRLRVDRCQIEKEGLVVQDAALAGWKVAAAELAEIRAID